MNLLVKKNNYNIFNHQYSAISYDTAFYIYLKKQYSNINLNQINVRITKEKKYNLFISDLDNDFCSSKKEYYKEYKKKHNMYIIKDNFLEYGQKNNERFHFFTLTINDLSKKCGHANLLIYDRIYNIVYRFEPNGDNFYTELSDYLSNYFSSFNVKFSLLKGFHYKKIIYGPQDFAKEIELTKNQGTCMYWSYMFCNLIQENYNNYYLDDKTTLDNFTLFFYYELYKQKFSYSGFINNFIYKIKKINIEKLVDPSVDKKELNWKRICLVQDLSEEYIKKILKYYPYYLDTICKYQNLSEKFIKENNIYSGN